ncbi:unnamed protein product [Pleuronectes platessa]|uniref:Uncharacterized protein n=1 Tax=Pleuronectes platessa TaxID=8262 RepID=A0A9N7ZCX8_PLEPL|nr:unnamed protein product [Pleuronectes platessa]
MVLVDYSIPDTYTQEKEQESKKKDLQRELGRFIEDMTRLERKIEDTRDDLRPDGGSEDHRSAEAGAG